MNEYVIAKYIRLSIEDGITESLSISNQRQLLDRYIDELDIPITSILEFVDNGYTGTNLERPELQQLIELVRCGEIDCIITKDFSRFSRSAIESGYFIEQVFPLYGVRFISIGENFDSDKYKDSTGGIDVAFRFLMHENYSKDLSQKVKSAKQVQMLAGENIVANSIYGYRKNDNGKWEPDTIQISNPLSITYSTADVVKQIFRMSLDGLSTSQIRDKLCAEKYPTPREHIDMKRGKEIDPKCIWTARMVLHILENEQYAGTYVAGKQESKAVGSHSKIHTDKSTWITIPDSHPPIVSKEDFEKVQELLKYRKNSRVQKPLQSDMSRPKRSRMLKGDFIAATPIYGYLKTENGKWEVDETAAVVIKEIYQMALKGLHCAEISSNLSEKSIPTPSEHIKSTRGHNVIPQNTWTTKSVRSILKNIQYTGAYVSGKILKDYETGKSYHIPENEWIIIPDSHPPIIEKTVFDKVQESLMNTKTRRNKTRQEYLLHSKVSCGCCGYALAYDASSAAYRCHHTYGDPSAECHKMKINSKELDEIVMTTIKKQAESILKTDNLQKLHKPKSDDRLIRECEMQIQKCVEQHQNLFEQFVSNEIDRSTYMERKDDCNARLNKHKNRLVILKQAKHDKQTDIKIKSIAKEAVNESATPKDIVNTLIEKISVYPDNHIEINWKFASFACDM